MSFCVVCQADRPDGAVMSGFPTHLCPVSVEQFAARQPAPPVCGMVIRLLWGGRSAGDWIPERCQNTPPCPVLSHGGGLPAPGHVRRRP